MNKPIIKEAIIVEGRYDKNKLSGCVSASIIETGGFGAFTRTELLALLRKLAKSCGIIIMTDSDAAGFMIRNHLKGAITEGTVKHAYIPDIEGKERRKRQGSKEGKLGVEGMNSDTIIAALIRAGATIEGELNNGADTAVCGLTKADLFALGYSGTENSSAKRTELLKNLGLPQRLSASGMLDVINALYTREEALVLLSGFFLGKGRSDDSDKQDQERHSEQF